MINLQTFSESINCQRFEYFTLNDRTYRVEDPVFLPLWIWLILSHFIASRCSPSVLDRLNPLLEPNGVLSINGRGIVGDSVPTITPHPNFRYILSCIHITIGQGDQCIKEEGEVWYVLCYNYKSFLCALPESISHFASVHNHVNSILWALKIRQ